MEEVQCELSCIVGIRVALSKGKITKKIEAGLRIQTNNFCEEKIMGFLGI